MNWKNVGDTVQAFVTAGAIVVGGVFTYFKFIKDRVYRPRVNLGIDAAYVELSGGRFLVCRFTVENKGATKLTIQHAGTVAIIRPGTSGADVLDATSWRAAGKRAVVVVFKNHAWVESAETIRDEVVVRVSPDTTCIHRVELRLVVARPSPLRRGNIEISSACVVPPTQSLSTHQDAQHQLESGRSA